MQHALPGPSAAPHHCRCLLQNWTRWRARPQVPGLQIVVAASRRSVLHSFSLPAALPLLTVAAEALSPDGRTVVNSILGAYGLPQLKAAAGLRFFDDFDSDFTFAYPRSWVGRPNRQREGLYLSDFNTADKAVVEVLEGVDPAAGQEALVEATIAKLVMPALEVGGDSRLEMPPKSRIKAETTEHDGQGYTYIAFPSETITRSGYNVRRKNVAVVAVRRGRAYILGTSARSDQASPEKMELLNTIVASFRLR